jgi:SAM-dependent methyltransferase
VAEVPTGQLGVGEALREFVGEMPYERRPILDFVIAAAQAIPPGSRVADVGAGDAPYRELFAHVDYVTVDWEESPHDGAGRADVIASAEAIPLDDASVDAVLCTQLLEHLPQPRRALDEFHRMIRPGGRVYLTAPLVWELHELPHDYYRYTENGLRHLLESAGFTEVAVEARNDCFTTVAQLMLNLRHVMGRASDGLDARREAGADLLADLAGQVAALAPLDVARELPLGYAATAARP